MHFQNTSEVGDCSVRVFDCCTCMGAYAECMGSINNCNSRCLTKEWAQFNGNNGYINMILIAGEVDL